MHERPFLLFIKRLDEIHTREESKAEMLGTQMDRRIFPEGADDKGEAFDNLRWSRFKNFEAREMMRIVDEHVFPFLRQMGEEGSSYGTHMKDARLPWRLKADIQPILNPRFTLCCRLAAASPCYRMQR